MNDESRFLGSQGTCNYLVQPYALSTSAEMATGIPAAIVLLEYAWESASKRTELSEGEAGRECAFS